MCRFSPILITLRRSADQGPPGLNQSSSLGVCEETSKCRVGDVPNAGEAVRAKLLFEARGRSRNPGLAGERRDAQGGAVSLAASGSANRGEWRTVSAGLLSF